VKIYFLMHTVYGPGGGVQTVVRNLAEDLAQRHDVEIVSIVRSRDEPVHPIPESVQVRTLVDARPGHQDDPKLGVPSRLIPRKEPHYRAYSAATDRALKRFFRSLDQGAVIGMQPGTALAIARLAKPGMIKIGQDHRPAQVRRALLRRALARQLPKLDAFLTLTEADADTYRSFLDPNLRIEAIPNATPVFRGTTSTLENKVVTAAGHLRRAKGFDRLVAAWADVAAAHPDWELRIFGTGQMGAELEQQITDLGLEGKVRLMGYSTRLREDVADSSLFVLSSRVEGYGMVLVEAMSCGVPVVSFDAPHGPASIINDGVDGYLVPNDDIAGLARRINEVIEMGPEGRHRLADAGLRNASERSQPAIASRWEKLLEEIAETKAAKDSELTRS
jgi:glycosyltransferase involved in cell wall biosynthesis